jgi:hypothetical protein
VRILTNPNNINVIVEDGDSTYITSINKLDSITVHKPSENSATWGIINRSSNYETGVDMLNLGFGIPVYATLDVDTFLMRTLVSESNSLIISNDSTYIYFNTNGQTISGFTSIASGSNLVIDSITGGVIFLNPINEGYGIDISNMTISVETSIFNNVKIQPLGGISLVGNQTGPNMTIKGLTAGSFINVLDNGTSLLLNANVPPSSGNVNISPLGGISLVGNQTGPNMTIKGLTAGSGILLIDNGTSIVIDSTVDLNTAYGELSVSNIPSAPYVLSITDTFILLTPSTIGGDMFNFTRLSDGILRYTGLQDRYIFIEFDLDLSPADPTYFFTFELRKNGSIVLDTRNTFLVAGYQHISLQGLSGLITNDTISIFVKHNNIGGGSINTNVVYYNLVCCHQQYATDLVHTVGQYRGSQGFGLNATAFNTFTTIMSSHPNINIVVPNTIFIVNATGVYTINNSAIRSAGNGSIPLTWRYKVNSITVNSFTSPSLPLNGSFQMSASVVLVAGDVFALEIVNGGQFSTIFNDLSIIT